MQVLTSKILDMSAVWLNIDWTAFIILALFTFLFLSLTRLIFKPFLRTIDLRDEKTIKTRKKAEQLQKEATKIYQEHQETVAQARIDAQEVRRQLRLEGLKNKEEHVSQASQEANEFYEESHDKIHQQFEEARTNALKEVRLLARSITTKVLGREVSNDVS